jgi:hypothetical protein
MQSRFQEGGEPFGYALMAQIGKYIESRRDHRGVAKGCNFFLLLPTS